MSKIYKQLHTSATIKKYKALP